ncbi:hypothetical protein GCM10027605_31420 [Micromonospora zhanjiangensis]
MLGALAALGAVATALLWTTADGGSRWLYRGGLTVAALATAAVVGHVVLSPRSPTARVLALPPLVALGRISYGIYLWHWPLFQWLTAERVGLTGGALLGARCAATMIAATASYLLVERPIRRARRLPVRAGAAVTATAAVTAAAVAVFATVPPALAPAPPVALDATAAGAAGPAASGSTGPGSAAPVPPVRRPGRPPGKPRVVFLGDSVSWSLGTYLPAQDELAVTVRAVQGCGIARLPELRYVGDPHPNYPGCDRWDERWRRGCVRTHRTSR